MADTRLFRVILQVGDVDRAATFYATLLGEPGRRIHGSRHYFDCGDVILALVDPGPEHARPLPDHVYFAVPDVEARHTKAKTLGALSRDEVHGAPAADIVERPWGERSFYAVDPWGNKLCFVDAATVFTGT